MDKPRNEKEIFIAFCDSVQEEIDDIREKIKNDHPDAILKELTAGILIRQMLKRLRAFELLAFQTIIAVDGTKSLFKCQDLKKIKGEYLKLLNISPDEMEELKIKHKKKSN